MFIMTMHATPHHAEEAARQVYQAPVIRRFGSIGELTLSRGCKDNNDNANNGQACNSNNINRTRA